LKKILESLKIKGNQRKKDYGYKQTCLQAIILSNCLYLGLINKYKGLLYQTDRLKFNQTIRKGGDKRKSKGGRLKGLNLLQDPKGIPGKWIPSGDQRGRVPRKKEPAFFRYDEIGTGAWAGQAGREGLKKSEGSTKMGFRWTETNRTFLEDWGDQNSGSGRGQDISSKYGQGVMGNALGWRQDGSPLHRPRNGVVWKGGVVG